MAHTFQNNGQTYRQGQPVQLTIGNFVSCPATFTYKRTGWYVCTDTLRLSGADCDDKLGFRFSYWVGETVPHQWVISPLCLKPKDGD